MNPARITQKDIFKHYWMAIFPLSLWFIGHKYMDSETEKYAIFRDKSALFGGNVKPGDPPSWP